MSKDWTAAVADAEAAAEARQQAEEAAHERFSQVRAEYAAAGRASVDATRTEEFQQWMTSRRETDEAWGVWAMAMDAKPQG
jgi:hypothetical protein